MKLTTIKMTIKLMQKDITPRAVNHRIDGGINFTSTDASRVMLPLNDEGFKSAALPLLEQMFDDDWDILKDALNVEFFIDLNVQPENIMDRYFKGITGVSPVRTTVYMRITCPDTGDVITRQLDTDSSQAEADYIAAAYLIDGCKGLTAKRQQDVTARLYKWFNNSTVNGVSKASIICDSISIAMRQMGVTGGGEHGE